MNDEELDRLIAQSTYSNSDVRLLDLRVGEADLLENIMSTNTPPSEHPGAVQHPRPRRRRRKLLLGLGVGALLASGAGVTYAVANGLSPEGSAVVDELGDRCGISSENARLVASTTSNGRTVEFWTVDDANSSGDLLFESGAEFGGGGCGPLTRAESHPHLPWVNSTISFDPRDGTGLGHFNFFGQAPAGTVSVDIVTTEGTIHADVTSPDGYFVVLADLPMDGSPPPGPPPETPMIERIDAFGADGTLLGTGGES